MSPFELIFAFFGLLLGLAIAEVLSGFSRALKLRRGARPVRIGWLTPMLGLFVILDLTSFWLIAYYARDQLQPEYVTLIGVLAIVGIYYLAATLIFPDDPEEWPDFDAWYDRQNRMVLGGMLAANFGAIAGQIALEITAPTTRTVQISETAQAVTGLGLLAMLFLMVALIVVKSRRVNIALLAMLILLSVVTGAAETVL